MPNLVPLSLSLWAGIYQVLFAFRAGSGVVLMDRFSPADFAALVARHQLRSTVLPPAALTMLLHDETVTDLSPLQHRAIDHCSPVARASRAGSGTNSA